MEIVDDLFQPLPHRFVDELQDYEGTIAVAIGILTKLQAEHGPQSTIMFDAGHSNVSCVLITEADQAAMIRRKAAHEERKLRAKEKRDRKLYEQLKARFEKTMEPVNEQRKAV